MSRLKIVTPVQLELVSSPSGHARPPVWAQMPEAAQGAVVALLARLIAREVAEVIYEAAEEVS